MENKKRTQNSIMEEPLVSVPVITYNSSEYIIEGLESIKAQTYKNIELIISDDCSTDNTVELCREWLAKNKDRFVRTSLVTSEKNTGTAGNCNRAISYCHGEWIKMLAGDDLLLPDCIEKNIEYITKMPDAEVVFSNVQVFKVKNEEKVIEKLYFTKEHELFFSLSNENQLKMLLRNNILPAASSFIRTTLLKKYRYDETYFCLEDAPMWITLLQNGIKFFAFNDITAMYRIGDSVMRGNDVYFKRLYFESYIQLFWNKKICLCKKYHLEEAYNITRKYILQMELADLLLRNKKSYINNLLYLGIKIFIRMAPKFKL